MGPIISKRLIVVNTVGFIDNIRKFIINKTEVNELIALPLKKFLLDSHINTGEVDVRNQKIETLFYKIEGNVIWGATAMIMSEFTEIVRRSSKH